MLLRAKRETCGNVRPAGVQRALVRRHSKKVAQRFSVGSMFCLRKRPVRDDRPALCSVVAGANRERSLLSSLAGTDTSFNGTGTSYRATFFESPRDKCSSYNPEPCVEPDSVGRRKLRFTGLPLVVIFHELLRCSACCGAKQPFLRIWIVTKFFRQHRRQDLLITFGSCLV
jgi:hypothetical protein